MEERFHRWQAELDQLVAHRDDLVRQLAGAPIDRRPVIQSLLSEAQSRIAQHLLEKPQEGTDDTTTQGPRTQAPSRASEHRRWREEADRLVERREVFRASVAQFESERRYFPANENAQLNERLAIAQSHASDAEDELKRHMNTDPATWEREHPKSGLEYVSSVFLAFGLIVFLLIQAFIFLFWGGAAISLVYNAWPLFLLIFLITSPFLILIGVVQLAVRVFSWISAQLRGE